MRWIPAAMAATFAMLTCGVDRSEIWKVEPPLRRSMNFAVAGVSCIRPLAPAREVWSRKRDSV